MGLGSTLVIENDLVLKRFYQQALKNRCPTLHVVTSAREAMELLETQLFDFVITDLQLPGESSAAILDKAKKQNPHIKALVASGYCDDEKYKEQMAPSGVVKGYLQKPFTIHQLLEKIENILQN